MYLVIDFLPTYNASTNFYLQKSPRNPHVVSVCHILELNIIQCNCMKYYFQGQWEYVRIDLIHMYSYENMLAEDLESEFILGYIQKFHRSKLLREVQQTDGL